MTCSNCSDTNTVGTVAHTTHTRTQWSAYIIAQILQTHITRSDANSVQLRQLCGGLSACFEAILRKIWFSMVSKVSGFFKIYIGHLEDSTLGVMVKPCTAPCVGYLLQISDRWIWPAVSHTYTRCYKYQRNCWSWPTNLKEWIIYE